MTIMPCIVGGQCRSREDISRTGGVTFELLTPNRILLVELNNHLKRKKKCPPETRHFGRGYNPLTTPLVLAAKDRRN